MALTTVAASTTAIRVADSLRSAIYNGELLPGQRLVERKLAAELGVSHIPVREALARLDEEGLVERLPHKGARVVELTQEELEEISSLRTVLEQFVCDRAQQRWNADAETALRAVVADMVQAARDGDLQKLFVLDSSFHEMLWGLADHRVLLTVASQLRGRIKGFLQAANAALGSGDLVEHAKEHEILVDALATGDRDRARTAMAHHIAVAADRIAAAK